MPLDLTSEERAALLDLLHADPREVDDAVAAVMVAVQRRQANSTNGSLAIQAAHRNGMSWRELSRRTGVAVTTLRDWGKAMPDEGDDQ